MLAQLGLESGSFLDHEYDLEDDDLYDDEGDHDEDEDGD